MKHLYLIYFLFFIRPAFGQCTLTFIDSEEENSKKVQINKDHINIRGEVLIDDLHFPPGGEINPEDFHDLWDTVTNISQKLANMIKIHIVSNCGEEFFRKAIVDQILYSPGDSLRKYFPKVAHKLKFNQKYRILYHIDIEPQVKYSFYIDINRNDSIVSLPPLHIEGGLKNTVSLCKAFSNIQKKYPDKASLEIDEIRLLYDWVKNKSYFVFAFSDLKSNYKFFKLGCENHYNLYRIKTDFENGETSILEHKHEQLCLN